MSEQITEQEWEQIAERAYEGIERMYVSRFYHQPWSHLYPSEKQAIRRLVKVTAQALKEWADKTKSPDTEIKELTEAQISEVWNEIAASKKDNPEGELSTWEDETKGTTVAPIFAKVINTIRARYPVTAGVDHSKEMEQAVEAAQPAEVKAEVKPIDMAVLRVMVENAWNKEHNRVRGLKSPCLVENYQMPGRSYRSVIHDNFWSELQEPSRSIELTWAKALLEEAADVGYLPLKQEQASTTVGTRKLTEAESERLLYFCENAKERKVMISLLEEFGLEVDETTIEAGKRMAKREKIIEELQIFSPDSYVAKGVADRILKIL